MYPLQERRRKQHNFIESAQEGSLARATSSHHQYPINHVDKNYFNDANRLA